MSLAAAVSEIAACAGYTHYRADEDDWPCLVALRFAAERRLRALGSEQWHDTGWGLERLWQFLRADDVYVIRDHAEIAGCFTMSDRPDVMYWGRDPEKYRFMYINTAMTAPGYAHRGVGAYIVSTTLAEARARGHLGARLDYWRDSEALRAVWERHGFTYLRTHEVPGHNSGALMEMRLS